MSTLQDTDSLSLPAPQTSASSIALPRPSMTDADANDPTDSDRRRQKRRRVEVDSDIAVHPSFDQQPSPLADNDTSQPSASTLTQISTWEIPPDIVPDDADAPHPLATSAESFQVSPSSNRVLTDQCAAATPLYLSAPIEISDSDDPTIELTQTDRTTPGSPIIVHENPASPSRALLSNAAETAAPSILMPEPLTAYTCPICFSPPTNATLTPCGHVCCGQCLFTAVKSTIRRSMVLAMERAPTRNIDARCVAQRLPGWDGRGGGVIGLKMQVMYSL
ncbi:hypothetical protein JVU11DRAFT_3909 [Chiua virens]|nr:hypothetical protein JVU11DRAFT_3909 [Chiua virens]